MGQYEKLGRIHVIQDNLNITESDNLVDFTIEDNCYVNDKFLGTTVAKKVTMNIQNPNSEIDLENKEIIIQTGMKIGDKEELIPFGNYIIPKPETEEVKGKTNFIGYDYMIKFNVPYKNRVTFPAKASILFADICEQSGVEVGNTDFTNSNYMILGNPFTNNENCRVVLSNIAQLAGGFAKIGRDNKAYIISLKNISNLTKIKDINKMSMKDFNIIPVKMLTNTEDNTDEKIDGNNYFDDFTKNKNWGKVNSLILRISGIDGENTVEEDKQSIQNNGLTELIIEDNYFLINQEEREKIIKPLWEKLKGIEYLPFKTKYYGYPYLDSGDMIYVVDPKENGYISYAFNHSFTFNGTYSGTLETPSITKTQTAYKNTVDEKTKFRRVERTVDKINGKIEDVVQQTTENSEKLTKHEQDINSITDTVQAVETNLNENYSTTEQVESKIEQKAGVITSETTKKIEDIQVGGTNLIRNSAPYDRQYWTGYNITSVSVEEDTTIKRSCMKTVLKAGQSGVYNNSATYTNLEKGKEYSISIWLKTSRNQQIRVGYEGSTHGFFDVTTEWKKYTFKFTCVDSTRNFIVYATSAIAGDILYFHSLKLEEGNKITTWSPSPDDTATKVEMDSKIEQTAESINSEVKKKVGNDEVISKINQSAEKIGINANKIELSASDILNLLAGNTINISSKNIAISSTNFNVDKNGNLVCKNAQINDVNVNGGNVNLTDNGLGAYEGKLKIQGDAFINGLYSEGIIIRKKGAPIDSVSGNSIFLHIYDNKPELTMTDSKTTTLDVRPQSFSYCTDSEKSFSFNRNGEFVIDGKKCLTSSFDGNINIENINFMPLSDGQNYGYIQFVTQSHGSVGVYVWQSDERIKRDIENTEVNAIDIIKLIKHRKFKYKESNLVESIGYIAQELEEINNNFVAKIPQKDGSETYQINETKIIPYVTKAIQEQQEEIEELKQKDKDEVIASLISRVEKLEKASESNE